MIRVGCSGAKYVMDTSNHNTYMSEVFTGLDEA
jgi:hypothetical protein